MSASASKTILITGANRGIGLALSKIFLQQGWTVVAAVRDLAKLPKLEGKVIPVKIDSASPTDALEAVEELKAKHGITHLDVALANAGIAGSAALAKTVTADEIDELNRVNVRGPVLLFQAVLPLLKDGDKFAVISSIVGANSPVHYPGAAAYGATKAAVNFLTRSIHFEEPALTVFSIHPGWVDTDMGNAAAQLLGLPSTSEKLSDTAPAIVKLVTSATRDTHGGYMWRYDGSKADW
ncbi:hypothetical protein IAT38_005533 [Cryptococcus sp. DSM 104549]